MELDTRHRRQFEIRLQQYDIAFTCYEDQTILNAALEHGLILANSCRNGTCRTCLCRLESGDIHYTIEWPGVSFDEKADRYFLPCVATPLSDLVLAELLLVLD